MTRHLMTWLCLPLLAATLVMLPGCKEPGADTEVEKKAEPKAEAAPQAEKSAEMVPEGKMEEGLTKVATATGETLDAAQVAAVEAKLIAADALDGETDKIVVRCPMCALGMNGHEQFAAKYRGYSLYCCSAHCLESFNEKPGEHLLAVAIPEGD